ncbi:hypothetical protein BDB01DRAFT_580750 [Pilobolus umbonatus]|nr:hypothetical protein BDB01DRAFT_580750 [Pilobolus umbonatus]
MLLKMVLFNHLNNPQYDLFLLFSIMKHSISIILLLLIELRFLLAVNVQTAQMAYCSYLIDKIYCAGNFTTSTGTRADMIALNVNNDKNVSVSAMQSSWEVISLDGGFSVADRNVGQCTSSPDRTKMFIQGGFNGHRALFDAPFIMFDATDNSWSSMPDYRINNVNDSQIHRGSASYIPSVDKLVFYGGLTQLFSNGSVEVNGVNYQPYYIDVGPTLFFGFRDLTTFDVKSQQWSSIHNAPFQRADLFYFNLATVYVPNRDSMFVFGGQGYNDKSEYLTPGLNLIGEVSFPDYSWTYHSSTGDVPVKTGEFTTTLLPDGETVLLYGGYSLNTENSFSEDCSLLNLNSMVWKRCSIRKPTGLNSNRHSHSATLVGNNLFILFGGDAGQFINDVVIMDVSNPDRIQYLDIYAYSAPAILEEPLSDKKGLGTGAIVGIAVGCVVLIALVIGWFIYKRRKRLSEIQDFPADWDQIDDHFNNDNEDKPTVVNHHHEDKPAVVNHHQKPEAADHQYTSEIAYTETTVVSRPSDIGSVATNNHGIIKPVEIQPSLILKPNSK